MSRGLTLRKKRRYKFFFCDLTYWKLDRALPSSQKVHLCLPAYARELRREASMMRVVEKEKRAWKV